MTYVLVSAAGIAVVLLGLLLVELIRKRIIKGRYQERLNKIYTMFQDPRVSSRQILTVVVDLRVTNDNDDLKALTTLLKYRMRTRAFDRFMDFYNQ